MTTDLLDLLRVMGAFALVFIVAPYFARRRRGDDPWLCLAECLAGTVLFAEITGLVLGRFGFCLFGSVTVAYVGFIAFLFLASGKGRLRAAQQWWRRRWYRLLNRLERGQRSTHRPAAVQDRRLFSMPLRRAMLVVVLGTCVTAAWYPLANVRFQDIESYSRALSLEILVRGQAWEPDGTVAFLTPVLFVSGLHGDTVVRYSNVALVLVLVLAAGYAVSRHTRSETAAVVAMCMVALIVLGERGTPEMSSAEMAAIFWLLALAFLGRSRWYCSMSAALGLLISLTPDVRSVLLLSATTGVIAVARLLRGVTRRTVQIPGIVVLLLFGWIHSRPVTLASADGPIQYESAARVLKRIVSEYQPNDWLIVSPVHEIPMLYGRGWHVELMDFTKNFTLEQVSRPDFRFPYAPKDIFVFVEKVPLQIPTSVRGRLSSMKELDISVLTYQSLLGRAAVEFQAGRLMAAYAASHPAAAIFHEDSQLLVYHVGQQIPKPHVLTASKAATMQLMPTSR
jgi:hypothetical protein